jgi:alpha-glucosidase
MSVGELFASEPEQAPALFADRHLVFDWGLLAAPWSAEAYRAAIDARERVFGEDRWLANVLSNHDQSRQATRLAASAGIDDTDGVARAAAVVLLTLRGTPFLYYAEELGQRDVPVPDDRIIDPPARRALVDPDFQWWNRDLCRSPMPWTPEPPGHGFTTGTPWLPFGDDAAIRNVETETADPGSVLATYRRLIALRRSTEALRTGRLRLVEVGTPDVLAWLRETATERVLVIVDFADAERTVALPPSTAGAWRPVGGSHLGPSAPGPDGTLALRPLEAVILTDA